MSIGRRGVLAFAWAFAESRGAWAAVAIIAGTYLLMSLAILAAILRLEGVL